MNEYTWAGGELPTPYEWDATVRFSEPHLARGTPLRLITYPFLLAQAKGQDGVPFPPPFAFPAPNPELTKEYAAIRIVKNDHFADGLLPASLARKYGEEVGCVVFGEGESAAVSPVFIGESSSISGKDVFGAFEELNSRTKSGPPPGQVMIYHTHNVVEFVDLTMMPNMTFSLSPLSPGDIRLAILYSKLMGTIPLTINAVLSHGYSYSLKFVDGKAVAL